MNTLTSTDKGTDEFLAISRPMLIIVRGIPGSGKTYLATRLQELIGHDEVVVLDPDNIDYGSKEYIDLCKALKAEGIEEKFFPNRFLKSLAYQAVEAHKIIIWTQAFTLLDGFHRTINSVKEYAAEHGIKLPVLLVEVEITHQTAKDRAAKREKEIGRAVPDEAFARFIRDYVSFADQGYKTVIVHGDDDVSVSVASVTQGLSELSKE